MGKNKKNRRNNKKKQNNKPQEQKEKEPDQFDLAGEFLGLTEEQKQEMRENEAKKQEEEQQEEEYESTEAKAKQDMEQWEKLLGIQGKTDMSYEDRKAELHGEREKLQGMRNEREREELKRVNKKNKKLQKEADLIFFDKRSTGDKKLKGLYDLIMKVAKEQIMVRETQFDMVQKAKKIDQDIDDKNRGIDKVIQLKHTLNNVFQGLKEKNIEAYKKKDDAILNQQQAKKDMTKMFEAEIEKVTNSYQEQISIKEKYEAKKKELEELAEVRVVIEDKEKQINNLQTEINDQIENQLKSLMDKFNGEKAKYDKLTSERENLNEQYKGLKDKFHKYLEEIESGESKLKVYENEIESLKKKITGVVEESVKLKRLHDETLLKMSDQ